MSIQYGYMRVSTKDQNEMRQYDALLAFGIPKPRIVMDKQSGKDFERPAYQKLVHQKMRQGDLLAIKSIDRLGRNYGQILDEWRFITKDLGADIVVLDMPLLDTRKNKDLLGTLITDIVLQLLSYVAENERTAIRQRQAEGIAAARKRGVHLGRFPKPLPPWAYDVYHQWKTGRLSPIEIQKQYHLSKSSFYRLMKKCAAAENTNQGEK